MKRIITALAIYTICSVSLFAQNHYDGNISIGAKGGITMSRIQFSPHVPQTLVPGITMGLTARYMEEKNFGIIAELNLEQRGWKEVFEGYDYQYQRKLTYIQIPVLTHIYFGSNKFHGFFNAGPEVGFLLSESTSANFDYENIVSIPDFPKANRSTAQYAMKTKNKFDYGISAGLGMEMISGNKNSFSLEGRFYYGLKDIFSNHKKDPFSSSASMSIMVTLGYAYRIK